MSFATQEASAVDPDFQTQVRHALTTVALDVTGEATTVPGHAARVAYANRVLTGFVTGDFVLAVCRAVVNDGVTLLGVGDDQVVARLEFLWSRLSCA